MTISHCTYLLTIFVSLLTSACSKEKPTEVTLVFEQAKVQSLSMASSIDMGGGFTADVAESGLIKNRTCYLVHVTAPDLIVSGTGDSHGQESCKDGVPAVNGLGKLFGPFAYGSEAVVRVPSGASRRFDLIGFINPYPNDPNCTQPFDVRVTESSTPGERRVTVVYGNYVIDAEDSVPEGLQAASDPYGNLGFFFHSDVVNLAPGPQNVTMKKLAWSSSGSPEEYGCGGDSESSYVQTVEPFEWRFSEEDTNRIALVLRVSFRRVW